MKAKQNQTKARSKHRNMKAKQNKNKRNHGKTPETTEETQGNPYESQSTQRIIIGTLLMVGKKEIKPKEVEDILKQQDRRLAGKTVSSSGLFFLGPKYPQKYKIPGFKNNLI